MNGLNDRKSLTEVAYEKIFQKITTIEFEPGQRLEEKQLMDELGIGRTPIREALMRLVGDMMVESYRNKGFIVRPILLQNAKAVFEALRILEGGIATLAMRHDLLQYIELIEKSNEEVIAAVKNKDIFGLVKANHEFHLHLTGCSQNEYLIRSLHMVRCEAKRLAYLSYSTEIGNSNSLETHYQNVISQHELMIKALKDRDETAYKKVHEEHINDFQQRIVLYMTT